VSVRPKGPLPAGREELEADEAAENDRLGELVGRAVDEWQETNGQEEA
jgi:hypothetical protein